MDMMRKKPELLSPAGDMEKLKMAVAYGADAVYLAGTSFGMRSFAGNFSPEELPLAVAYAHDHGVRVHVTVNTMPRSGEVDALPAHLERLNDAGVDALILADLGAFTLAGKYAPRCERHISTQQSIANYACAQAWYDLGAKRVVLARELSRRDIAAICRDCPAEVEVFAHGALCMCYSGQCALSAVIGGRSGNRGTCAQPCRLPYGVNAPAAMPRTIPIAICVGRLIREPFICFLRLFPQDCGLVCRTATLESVLCGVFPHSILSIV